MKSTTAALREITGLSAQPQEPGLKYDLANSRYFEKGELDQQDAALLAQMASLGIAKVMQFCLYRPKQGQTCAANDAELRPFDHKTLQIAMRRFVAIAWLLHSEMLTGEDDDPLTLDQLGKLPQLDCTKVTLSLVAKKFGDSFGFHGRVQKRQDTKPNYASAAKSGWEKRRARQAKA
jgi:hypothetical protein